MNPIQTLQLSLSLLTLTSALTAQQTLRGKVEDVRNTTNQFFLDSTNIPLVSSALNLNLWIGQQAILQVVNVGTVAAPVLRVDAAVATAKVFDMGNLRLGRSERWQITAPAGSLGLMGIDWTTNTGYTPYGPLGTLLLGPNHHVVAAGFTNGLNQFEVSLTMPNLPALVGTSFTGQGFVDDHGNRFLTNPDSKVVRAD